MKIDHSKPPNEKMIVNIRDVKSTFANLLCCVGIAVGIRSIFHITDMVASNLRTLQTVVSTADR